METELLLAGIGLGVGEELTAEDLIAQVADGRRFAFHACFSFSSLGGGSRAL